MAPIHLVGTKDEDTFQNPIMKTGADPWIIQHEDVYYYCYSDNKTSIFISKANSPLEFDEAEPTLIWAAKSGKPYSHQTWAPELYHLDGKWYVYFAASNGRNSTHRLYVLEADKPEGPYRFKGQISPATDRWAIDGSIIEHDDGERYFVWSGWDGRANTQQNLYISKMKNPWTLVSGKNGTLKTRKLRRKSNSGDEQPSSLLDVEVLAPSDDSYVLEVNYTCNATSMHQLIINDDKHIGLHYHTTSPENWQTHYETIDLKKGRNVLSFASGIGTIQVKEVRVKVRGSDRMMISSPEFAWEKMGGPPFVNEGPAAIKKNGLLHLVYSASGSWTDDYQMGLLTFSGGDILDKRNWKKKPTPIFSKTTDVFGPGHASFIRFKEIDWIVYHTAKHSGAGWNREVRMQPYSWAQNDHPLLGTPSSNDERISLKPDQDHGVATRDQLGA